MKTRPRYIAPKDGDFQVWNIINFNPAHFYPVEGWEHAKDLIHAMARSQLLQPHITDNSFGLEVFRDGNWEEWENEDGDTIDQIDR